MKSLLKYIEILFFVFINSLFVSGYVNFFLIVSSLGWFFEKGQIKTTIETQDNFISDVAILLLLIFILLFIFKVIIFPILYKMKNVCPVIHSFFDKFRDEIKFKMTIFATIIFLPVIIDILFFRLKLSEIVYSELFLGLGLLPSYAVMYIYLKLIKRKNAKIRTR